MLFRSFAFLVALTAPVAADVWSFERPSENIWCGFDEDVDFSYLTCTVIERSEPPAAARPAGCALDWGHIFFMRNIGPAEMHRETLSRNNSGVERVEYGATRRFGGFACHSSPSGLECRNEDNHGFSLSRSRQEIF